MIDTNCFNHYQVGINWRSLLSEVLALNVVMHQPFQKAGHVEQIPYPDDRRIDSKRLLDVSGPACFCKWPFARELAYQGRRSLSTARSLWSASGCVCAACTGLCTAASRLCSAGASIGNIIAMTIKAAA